VSAFGLPYAPYPPVQNGREKRGGLILPADYAMLLTAAERAKLATLKAPVLRLSYDAASDLMNAAAIAATTWTDLVPAQAFTIGATTAYFLVEVRLSLNANAVGLTSVAARAQISGATNVPLRGDQVAAGGWGNVGGATFVGTSFGGAQTIKIQVYGTAAFTAYCRASSQVNTEFAAIRILEISA
jgi:hypothetical protein